MLLLGCSYGYAKVDKYEESRYYVAAIRSIEVNDTQARIEYLNKEILEHPDNGYAYLYLAEIYCEKEDYISALARINVAIKYIPTRDKTTFAKALVLRSKIKCVSGQQESALADLNEAVILCPRDLEVLQERAELLCSIGEYDKSDADYRRMISLQPGCLIAEVGLGRNNVGRGKYYEAIKQFNEIIYKRPDYSQVYIFRSEANIGLGKASEAIDDIIKSIEIDQNVKATDLIHLINLNNAELLFRKFDAKYNSDRNNPMWPLYIGYIKEINREYLQAVSYYKKSYGVKSTSFCAIRLSECYKALCDWDNAIAYIDNAISFDKDNIRNLYSKSVILWHADRVSEAIAVATQCVNAQPNCCLYYYQRGWYKEVASDLIGALEDYTESLSKNPECAHAYYRRGRVYLKLGYNQKMQSDFEKCVKYDSIPSKNSCAQYALFYLGKQTEAKQFMESMLRVYPKDSYYAASCLYSLMGFKTTALDYLEKAFKNGYNNFNHILKDIDLENIRGEYRFKQLYEKYSNNTLVTKENTDKNNNVNGPSIVEEKSKTTIRERTFYIPYSIVHGATIVNGSINGVTARFNYIASKKLTISALLAEYFLSNGYISKSDCSEKIGPDGKIPIGSTIRLASVVIGKESFSNIKAVVVDNNQSPLVFGNKIFGTSDKVWKDSKRSVIKIIQTIKSN